MIYFITPVDGGPIKIGTTGNLPQRLKSLEREMGCPLAILATMPGGLTEEKAMHERFAAYRLGQSEQFRPVREILEFIGRPLLVSADPDAVEAIPMRRKVMAIQVRASEEWKAWADELAAFDGLTLAALIDRTLRRYARAIGFGKEAPCR